MRKKENLVPTGTIRGTGLHVYRGSSNVPENSCGRVSELRALLQVAHRIGRRRCRLHPFKKTQKRGTNRGDHLYHRLGRNFESQQQKTTILTAKKRGQKQKLKNLNPPLRNGLSQSYSLGCGPTNSHVWVTKKNRLFKGKREKSYVRVLSLGTQLRRADSQKVPMATLPGMSNSWGDMQSNQ